MRIWDGAPEPVYPPVTPFQAVRGVLRILTVVVITLIGLALFALLKGGERLGLPTSPRYALTRGWSRAVLWLLGIRVEQRGTPVRAGGAVVANHSTWMDILALRIGPFLTFMAKDEVAGWPGVGQIAKLNDTMFIARRAADARRQQVEMRERIDAGAHLCFFPEGTSTDSRHIAPFKPALFHVFMSDDLRDIMQIQPVALAWMPSEGQSDTFYGWWGEMDMGANIWHIATRSTRGRIVVNWRPALNPAEFKDRKDIAAAAEKSIRDGLAEMGIIAG